MHLSFIIIKIILVSIKIHFKISNNKSLGLEKLIYPKQGTLVAFLSTPNSYHAASELLTEKNKRVFIYGSYSLNKKVNWKKLLKSKKKNLYNWTWLCWDASSI